MKETRGTDRQIVEHTSPAWRLVGVLLMVGGLYYLGVWVRDLGWVNQFATLFTVAALFSAGFWARQRPDRLIKRFGAFGSIADEIRRSGDRIRADVYRRPLAFGVVIGILYGGLVVAAQALVATLLTSLVAWTLALGIAGVVAGIVASPEFFSGLFRSLSVSDEDEDDLEEPVEDEDLEDDEDELSRRRRASGEE